jgi:hypothetical protein
MFNEECDVTTDQNDESQSTYFYAFIHHGFLPITHHSEITFPNDFVIRKSIFRITAPFGNTIDGYPENRGAAAPFGNRFSE